MAASSASASSSFFSSSSGSLPSSKQHLLIETVIDYTEYPTTGFDLAGQDEVIFGDLHGNALKLLHLLLKSGSISLPKDNFNQFKELYLKAGYEYLSAEDMVLLESIIDSIKIGDSKRIITLLGDTLADRGSSDVLMLKLFNRLHQLEVPYRIIFSNHDMEFIWRFESILNDIKEGKELVWQDIMYVDPGDGNHQGNSSISLVGALQAGVISIEDLTSLVNSAYYNHLKYIDYTYQADSKAITLHSHAPLTLYQMDKLCREKFYTRLVPVDSSKVSEIDKAELIKNIDIINSMFYKIVSENKFTDFIPMDCETRRLDPGYQSVWTRFISGDDYAVPPTIVSSDIPIQPRRETSSSVRFVHGHSAAARAEKRPGVYNLDDCVGKLADPRFNIGPIKVLALPKVSTATLINTTKTSIPDASADLVRPECFAALSSSPASFGPR